MIRFEIIKSPDITVTEEFHYFKNELHLGKDKGDLLIDDHELRSTHVMIEIQGPDLLIHPQREVAYFLINGKRATAIRKLKVNDEVTIGQTVLKIKEFIETERETKTEILNRKLNLLIEGDSPRLSIIEKLTNLMKQ